MTFDSQNTNVWFHDSLAKKKVLQEKIGIQKAERVRREEEEQVNRKVERVTQYLKEFYQNDSQPIPTSNAFPLDNITSEREVTALDRKFKFTSENVGVVTKLFLERTKPNFLKLICEQDNILVDTSKLVINGKTILEELLDLKIREEFRNYIPLLFRKGYQLTETDKEILNTIYNKNCVNTTEHEREQIDRWVIVNFLNITKRQNAFTILKIIKILLSISSLKYNLVIGFRFNNHREISNNFFENYKHFGQVYLKAMKVYGHYDRQINEDRSGKLKLKIDRFISDKPRQERGYDEIIGELFPELRT